jgi:N-acetylglucosaminyldiphosphoundecaprenol N-acetyl-beta-D-mannosaminyltransferase
VPSSRLTDELLDTWRTCTVLGVEYFAGDVPTATAAVLRRVESGLGGYSCLCGVHGIITAQHSESMMSALDAAWLNFPDGAPVAWLMRRHGAGTARRVAGPDLMPRVIEAGQEAGVRHFLFGSSPDVLERLEQRLLDRFPRAIIAGSISPPFREVSDEENEQFAAQIAASRADIVWVGLGLPKQDEWLHRTAALFAPAVGLGVGAAFDFLAETKPRAPEWMQGAGLEWMHRLAKEPRRLAGRYATTNTEFLARAGVAVTSEYGRVARRLVARSRPGVARR